MLIYEYVCMYLIYIDNHTLLYVHIYTCIYSMVTNQSWFLGWSSNWWFFRHTSAVARSFKCFNVALESSNVSRWNSLKWLLAKSSVNDIFFIPMFDSQGNHILFLASHHVRSVSERGYGSKTAALQTHDNTGTKGITELNHAGVAVCGQISEHIFLIVPTISPTW